MPSQECFKLLRGEGNRSSLGWQAFDVSHSPQLSRFPLEINASIPLLHARERLESEELKGCTESVPSADEEVKTGEGEIGLDVLNPNWNEW